MKKYFYLIFSFICISSCSTTKLKPKWFKEKAPDNFSVLFETNKGHFEIEIKRQHSPKAVDRFYQLVKHNYFDTTLFYRVNPGFVAQFGGRDTITTNFWNSVKVTDEPVLKGNKKGTLSFARGGKDSRSTDLFINLNDNNRLDTIHYNDVTGFPSFGVVTKGMNVVESLYSDYADTPMENLNLMYENLNSFIEKYPKLDTIHKIRLMK